MFNLLVKHQAWNDGRDSIPAGRALEYTEPTLVDRFKPEGQLDLVALAALPTVFLQETSPKGDQVARIGTITGARVSGRDIVLDYGYDVGIPAFPNTMLQRFAADLDIKDYEFTRTHWSIKDSDLYRALLRNSQPRRQRPKVFQLAEYEHIESGLVSAMMPFDPSFDAVYNTLLRTAEKAGFRCRRADDVWESAAVMQGVISLIDRSNIVICDCTCRNPNVFYEIGIAHTLGREVILISQAEADVPFDLRHLRFVLYRTSRAGLSELDTSLRRRLSEVLQHGPTPASAG
jgi:hypothetical protein